MTPIPTACRLTPPSLKLAGSPLAAAAFMACSARADDHCGPAFASTGLPNPSFRGRLTAWGASIVHNTAYGYGDTTDSYRATVPDRLCVTILASRTVPGHPTAAYGFVTARGWSRRLTATRWCGSAPHGPSSSLLPSQSHRSIANENPTLRLEQRSPFDFRLAAPRCLNSETTTSSPLDYKVSTTSSSKVTLTDAAAT